MAEEVKRTPAEKKVIKEHGIGVVDQPYYANLVAEAEKELSEEATEE